MSALDWITVEGYRSIYRLMRLKLAPINILIGPNGSGKSNFVSLFCLLNQIRTGHLQQYVLRAGGANRILHFGSRHTDSLKIHISFGGETSQYSIELKPDEADGLFPAQEYVRGRNHSQDADFVDQPLFPAQGEAGISVADRSSRSVDIIQEHLAQWRLYHFHDTSTVSPMKATCDVNDNRCLRPDGSNLAAFLYLLRKRYETSYQLIRKTIRLAAPFFEDFQLEPLALNPDKIRLEWKHRQSDAYFDAASISDGTLRFMALTTLLLQPPLLRPAPIIMDEPELGLHPYAISLLASLIKQAAVKNQIILATQSSLLLDHFDPQDVLVANRINGATGLKRLEADGLQEWLEDYSLGQLWEKNELGGRPTPEP